jgi:hydrogenase nickel incorporation protein HypA/HybF
MHEVSLVSALVDQVAELSRQQGFTRVVEIQLAIGTASGVEPACVEFCFEEVTKCTLLEGAKLSLHVTAGSEFCLLELEVL